MGIAIPSLGLFGAVWALFCLGAGVLVTDMALSGMQVASAEEPPDLRTEPRDC